MDEARNILVRLLVLLAPSPVNAVRASVLVDRFSSGYRQVVEGLLASIDDELRSGGHEVVALRGISGDTRKDKLALWIGEHRPSVVIAAIEWRTESFFIRRARNIQAYDQSL